MRSSPRIRRPCLRAKMPDVFRLPPGISRDGAIRAMAAALELAGVEEARREARLVLLTATGLTHAALIGDGAAILTADERTRVEVFSRQRIARVPFARIIGRQEFYGLAFDLSPATLIPRADTEALVELVLEEAARRSIASPRILDLGTGTGAILAALLHALPAATGVGIDRSAEAVATASANLDRIAPARARVRLGDWFTGVDESYEIIVSNPPYIPAAEIAGLSPEVANGDPVLALDGGADGLDCYRAIARGAGARLSGQGFIAVEIGAGQQRDVTKIFEYENFLLLGKKMDLGQHVRALLFGKNATLQRG